MPDLFAHAVIGYCLGTALSFRYDWLTPTYVTVVMAGAFVPDVAKIFLLVPDAVVSDALGLPFSWFALHTVGGSAVAVLIGVVLVAGEERRRVLGLLSLGTASHLVADALLLTATGYSKPMWWPVAHVGLPSPGLYLSSEPTPLFVASAVAVVLWALRRRRAKAE
ncbi:metal-dependent hydrolase [Salinirubrum litoreum]|uniref:Metal-dependent hydrolase n=1 Tax=Salinirubrum litoreum TaxID=1126234 RepID=A0ABD5R5R5_9EURY|nr:metal-dependent hydrolase [Salinirubrum litoreum]